MKEKTALPAVRINRIIVQKSKYKRHHISHKENENQRAVMTQSEVPYAP